jgi:hypothetical protein
MHNTDILYVISIVHHKYTSNMHNLKTNFNKFFNITKSVFKDRLNPSDNFFFYPNKPKRANQINLPYPAIFKRMRKRIETLFAQLCDQFMLKRNYAKTILGLSVRIHSKITSLTLLQYINSKNDKPINHLKYALAS